jgi:hypothetical protein
MSEQLIQTPTVFGDNGNFLLERELGAGGMGGVYMGRDKMLDRPVAVKVMLKEYGNDEAFVEKFKKEAQAAARLIHPNIAQVYSYGICDGMPYIAMELVAGGSLFRLMQNSPGKTDVARVMKICEQVAQALRCATDQGLVHGDIKPENILLDANGNAKIVDFGLAAMQKDTDEIWGTPYYIAPEKVKKEPLDHRADMYSLGATLYHALTGVAPFEGEDPIAVVKKRFEGAPKKPSEIRPELTSAIDELILKMLEIEKDKRFPSYESLLEAFNAVLTSGLTQKPLTSTATSAGASPAAKTSAQGARRATMMRTRRAGMMRTGVKTKVSTATQAEKSSDTDIDEDEEEGGSIVGKVLLVVTGVIVSIALLIGGLVWYQVSDKKAREREEQRQILDGITKARSAIADNIVAAQKFADECDAMTAKVVKFVEDSTTELSRHLPKEISGLLKPAVSEEVKKAMEDLANFGKPPAAPETNQVVVATNAPPQAASTNAPPQAVTNSAAQIASPVPGMAQALEAKAAQLPLEIVAMQEVWSRTYSVMASSLRVRLKVKEIEAKAAEADEIKGDTLDNANLLGALSRELLDMIETMKSSKDVENIKKTATFVKQKGQKAVRDGIKRIKIERLEREREAQKKAAAEAEKKRQEEERAAKEKLIVEETSEIKAKFDKMVTDGIVRQLDWEGAERQLKYASDSFKTAEGQLAVKEQLYKIESMKKMQNIFIKALKGYKFRRDHHKIKGYTIVSADKNEIHCLRPDGKGKRDFTWQKFIVQCPKNLNELLVTFIVKGRTNPKTKLNLRDWADSMIGAALILRYVLADQPEAAANCQYIVKEVAKQYPDYHKKLKEIFPDVEFDSSAEE